MKLYKAPFILSSLTMAVLLASCGGGGSDSTTTAATSTTTSVVSGTVPGTLIEAFCADGTYYHVNSTDNGTTKHPFTLSIPSNVDCRLVMTTNEDDIANRVITSIQINSGSVVSGLINMSEDFDLGYIDLALNRADIDDANNDGIKDTPLEVPLTLPDGVVLRDVSSDSLDDDGDDIPDAYDSDYSSTEDSDGDGIDDIYDRDDDNDGSNDDVDSDDDGDGIPDSEDPDHDDSYESGTTTVYTPVAEYTVTSGRLLASQCAQCHGTNGSSTNSWDSIAGESAAELVSEMLEIKAGEEDLIMQAQAHGYTDSEIQALASWLATQPSSDNDD
ncbi:hypothetical protein THMIRHAM_19740 [Thiomicrorhabdus immobilis]|uniref:Cytochrome c domain-containing protein n=1 Tax=Thiomicrorhabdus immobilis TaxID=2791037 RepID=A0ABN6D2I8_9GAMM|nr:c-type cytochrome [Thiomicrorhabdus immobilis]BCN94189.1 hypothetical protein THMIRHAM_19740 [Thiomicrorhabdus immobilis]